MEILRAERAEDKVARGAKALRQVDQFYDASAADRIIHRAIAPPLIVLHPSNMKQKFFFNTCCYVHSTDT